MVAEHKSSDPIVNRAEWEESGGESGGDLELAKSDNDS
jgi:hypothetical protein